MELLYFTLLITGFLLGPTLYCGFLPVCFFSRFFPTQQTKQSEKKATTPLHGPSPFGETLVGRYDESAEPKPFCRIQVFPSSAPTADGAVAILKMPPGGSTSAKFMKIHGENIWKLLFFCDERGVHLDKKCEDVNLSIHIFWCYLLILILPVFEDPSYLFEKYVLRFLESKEIDQALTKTMKAEHWKNRWHTFQANELDYNWEIIIYIYSLYLYIYISIISSLVFWAMTLYLNVNNGTLNVSKCHVLV